VGEVVEIQGTWPLADDRARGVAEPSVESVYTVRFPAAALWGASGGHWVQVELWESYLEAVA
jgi:nitrile hydratase